MDDIAHGLSAPGDVSKAECRASKSRRGGRDADDETATADHKQGMIRESGECMLDKKVAVAHMKYSQAERKLAAIAHHKSDHRDVLYHGTRYAQSILDTDVLFCSEIVGQVCLTRSPEVAAYWAMMDRDDDEGCASIFVLNRQSLEKVYELKPKTEVFWHSATLFHDEAEEEIWDNVIGIRQHLVAVVAGPTKTITPEHRNRNWKYCNVQTARLHSLGI